MTNHQLRTYTLHESLKHTLSRAELMSEMIRNGDAVPHPIHNEYGYWQGNTKAIAIALNQTGILECVTAIDNLFIEIYESLNIGIGLDTIVERLDRISSLVSTERKLFAN